MKITEYLHHHDKGAGGACQGSFLFLFPMLYGYARSLVLCAEMTPSKNGNYDIEIIKCKGIKRNL